MKNNTIKWALRIVAAAILLQTLYFKFTGAPESIYIFSTMGIEPWGRIGSGVAELVASLLLLWPRTTWLGAGLALGTMAGAIASHLFVLGIEVQDDGGQLFMLAVVVAVCSALLLWMEKEKVLALFGSK
ncbi:MAG: DoxX family protein [Saprospiraceae bacterium]|nr:DoxX family protein [Saprospiraceae bacterium]